MDVRWVLGMVVSLLVLAGCHEDDDTGGDDSADDDSAADDDDSAAVDDDSADDDSGDDDTAADDDDSASDVRLMIGLPLSDADAKLLGEQEDDLVGWSVSTAGDVDGDGFDDIVIGAPWESTAGHWVGAVYLMHGPVSGEIDLSTADAKLLGEGNEGGWDHAGWSVSTAGDTDGDGRDEFLVAAPWANIDGRSGVTYLFRDPPVGTSSLAIADASFIGESQGDNAGYSVSTAGDVNGDGLDDILIGASLESTGGTDAGATYLILGPVSSTNSLADADAKLTGTPHDNAGYSVSTAGDVDGDGLDDILIGAPYGHSGGDYSGTVYLVYSPVSGLYDLALADATLVGENAGENAGYSVSTAGDVNGDGFDDILVGAADSSASSNDAEAVYMVHGPVYGSVDLSAADAKITGAVESMTGYSVSRAGDVNGDGLDDVLFGSPAYLPSGRAYLLLGPFDGDHAVYPYYDFQFAGMEPNDCAGYSVSTAGDTDGDGLDDLLISAPGASENGWASGAVYVVSGYNLVSAM